MEKQILKVVFRKFNDGEIIALFPQIKFGCPHYEIMSYMHIGQHSEVDHHAVVEQTTLATEEEYQALLNEIKNIYYDYDIKVMKKLVVKF